MFEGLIHDGFDVEFHHHAGSLIATEFAEIGADLTAALSNLSIKASTIVGSGGGETDITQTLRRTLTQLGWRKRNIQIDKTVIKYEGTIGKSTYQEIDRTTAQSLSHEIDHVKQFASGTALLEIEWNNKDPFFDRDLENFKRLHADGAASIGILITRGSSFQNGVESAVCQYARNHGLNTIDDLFHHGLEPTRRQQADILRTVESQKGDFPDGWAKAFVRDKYASSTTHWDKLSDRMSRGVGNPCPLLAIGIPISCVVQD